MNKSVINYLFGIDIIVQWEHEIGDQKRKHKKKRIAKKWLKKYGTWHTPCHKGAIYFYDNSLVMSRNTYAMIKDYTRWKLEFEPCIHHGNSFT